MTTISEYVYKIVEDYKNNAVEITAGYKVNAYDTIRRINLYTNNKYWERDDDAIFWNIPNSRIVHFAKNIDFDTKDLVPYGIGEYNFLQAWALKMKFRKWLDDSSFHQRLNDLADGLATYSTVIWKICKDYNNKKIEECDLRNIYMKSATVDCIRDTDVVELHYLSEGKLLEKKDVWDNVDEIIKKGKKNEQGEYEIWEFNGHFKKDEDSKMEFKHVIGSGTGDMEKICFEEPLTEDTFPYYDFHIGKYRGRFLRVGLVERLFDLQERANQLVNQNAQSTEIASLLLFRTADGQVVGNVLDSAINGQIINSQDLQQIGISNTGLNQFINEMQMIERQADRICLTPEIMSGEMTPSGTPFRSVAVVANNAKSAFRFVKETIGEKIGEILKKEILPSVVDKWNRGDIIEIATGDEDIAMYDKAMKEFLQRQTKIDNILNGKLLTPELSQMIDQNTNAMVEENIAKIGRKVEVPKGFFNFDYGIRFNVSGESVDKSQQNDAYFNALQMVMSNPAILEIPLFKQYLENNNIPYWKLSAQVKQELQQQQAVKTQGQPIAAPKQDALASMVDSTI
jgi:hypothetical protein